jgi:hypothetical protein
MQGTQCLPNTLPLYLNSESGFVTDYMTNVLEHDVFHIWHLNKLPSAVVLRVVLIKFII